MKLFRHSIAGLACTITALTLGAIGLLGSCDVATPVNPQPQREEVRPLPSWLSSAKVVCYSGYRENQSPKTGVHPSQAEIKTDLEILVAEGYDAIRIFNSGRHGSDIIQVIADNNLDLKVQLGIWIDGPKATKDAVNMADVNAGIALANTYKDIIFGVSVGNETMVDWSGYRTPVDDMVEYIKYVRERITQPVSTDDNWAFFANYGNKYEPNKILAIVDYATMHSYAFADAKYADKLATGSDAYWDWWQESVPATDRAAAMMAAAINKTRSDYTKVRAYLNTNGFMALPVIIGETGWKSVYKETNDEFMASEHNQAMYYNSLLSWTSGPKAIFYFQAFDEPWKQGDDGWGLHKVDRSKKLVLTGSPSPSSALYYIPTEANPTITVNTFQVYADTLTAVEGSVAVHTQNLQWIGWDNPETAWEGEVATGGSEGSKYMEIAPSPKDWGWGMLVKSSAEDLSKFASGHLNFSIRTTYGGKLEIGFMTGVSSNNTGVDVYLPVAVGQYGYQNDGQWHLVSVPVAEIIKKAAPAWNQPATAAINLKQVTNSFVIADRYEKTGNTASAVKKIDIDNIYWTQN